EEARTTRLSVIAGVQEGDEAAWQRFFAIYHPRLLAWCRGCGLQDSDARNVSQDVMVKVFKAISAYDPSRPFKPWLREIWRNTFRDLKRVKTRRGATAAESAIWKLLPDDGPDLSEELIKSVQARAHELVSREVKPTHWALYVAHDINEEESSTLA